MLRLPAEWIAEFEVILRQLYWSEAIAFIEFTGIRYEWRVDEYLVHDPKKPGNFKLRCRAGNMEDLPYDVAIEGEYPNGR